jgi:basic membrane lipoprotein Med (substrate-binding protein (PBP1-ABC) superfamily)
MEDATTRKPSLSHTPSRRELIAAGALAGAALLLPRAARAAGKPIGFIYVGPRMDYGYNYSMDQGRLFVEKTMKVKTLHQENVPETAEVTRVMEKMIRAGCEIIFATSYGYLDYAIQLGDKYPHVKFLHAGGLKTSANVGTYFANSDDAMYLAGMAAGGTSKSGKLGFVAAFPIPQVLRSIDAYTMGAQAVNAKATTTVVWTGGWLNPAKEAEAANSLADAGVDVIGEQIDSPITLAKTAQKRGIFVVGKDVDVQKFADKAYLTGASWNWGPMMVDLVKQIGAGTWKPAHVRGDLKDGTVGLDPLGAAVPAPVKASIEKAKADILAGKLVVWKGPVLGQDGKTLVADGKVMATQDIETVSYLVKGVVGTVK